MLKDYIKSNNVLHIIAIRIKKMCIYLWVSLANIYNPRDCLNIKKYKNIHAGKRCFIVATGPSLTMEDLGKIKNELSFSMNSIINIYDKTSYRPTYYLIQDGNVERKLHNKLMRLSHKASFMGIGDILGFKAIISRSQARPYADKFEFYNLKIAYHIYKMCYEDIDRLNFEFSENCSIGIFDGCTVTYSAIQLAVYMGFKEIYLLGCDTNYSGHIEDKLNKKDIGSSETIFAMVKAYETAKRYADLHGIKIYNATRGGNLEVFERVDFDDIINKI